MGDTLAAPAQGVVKPSSRRARWAAQVLVLAVVAAQWAPRLGGPIDLHYDGAVYYVLGASLATGHGYRLTNEPGEIEALQYPPLLSLGIAAHMCALGSTDPVVVAPVLRRTYVLLSAAFALALFALAARILPTGFALLATVLCVLSFRTVLLVELLYPELPFALVTVLFFLAAGSSQVRWKLATGPLAIAAYLLRTAGLALLSAWVVEALLARAWKAALVRAVLCALPVVLWQAYGARVEASDAYQRPAYSYQRAPYLYTNVSYGRNLFLVDPFAPERGSVDLAGFLARFGTNSSYLPPLIGEMVTAPSPEWIWPITVLGRRFGLEWNAKGAVGFAMGVVGLVVVIGLVLLARRGEHSIPLYVLCSLGVIAATPWPVQFGRYLAPLCPFLALAFAVSLRELYQRFACSPRFARVATPALALLVGAILAVQGWTIRSMFLRSWRPNVLSSPSGAYLLGHTFFLEQLGWHGFQGALTWIRSNAAPDAVVASTSPQLVYLSTGRKSVMPPMESDLVAAQAAFESVPVAYVILDELNFTDVLQRYTRPLLEARPDLWQQVFAADAPSQLQIWRRR